MMTEKWGDILIRPFEKGDRQLVTDFFDQMGPESRGFFNSNDGNRNGAMRFFDSDDKNNLRFMAVEDGRMVGYVFFYHTQYRTPWLGIAIAEDYKGKHLGRRLLAFMEDFARSHGKHGIILTTHIANVRAQSLYRRMGYTRMGIHDCGEVLFLRYFEEQDNKEFWNVSE